MQILSIFVYQIFVYVINFQTIFWVNPIICRGYINAFNPKKDGGGGKIAPLTYFAYINQISL